MLSGEVELYLPALNQQPSTSSASSNFEINGVRGVSPTKLKILDAGSLFGDLNLSSHSCSARVRKTSEFVRIPQEHFFSLYKKHADHLQPFILVMEDLVSEVLSAMATPTKKERRPQSLSNAREPPTKSNSPYNFSGMRKELSAQLINNHRASFNLEERWHLQPFNEDHLEYVDESPPKMLAFSSSTAANLFELSNSIRRLSSPALPPSCIHPSQEASKKNQIVFHHDNARPHVENRVVQSINEKGWDLLEHPPYSPTKLH
uniref:Cyclic nucleotide-binding domain-containing protein n=1 Tax=Ditylenchus dipsaci TaxID=166011 RepID=A0A915DRX5_9BILA